MTLMNKRPLIILGIVAGLLLIPFVAMQVTSEVNWGVFDFVVMGSLLFGVGLLIDLVLRKIQKTTYRVLLLGGILLAFFLIWAELAVGIFGTPFAGS